jgi:hypothetical protein
MEERRPTHPSADALCRWFNGRKPPIYKPTLHRQARMEEAGSHGTAGVQTHSRAAPPNA